MVDRLLNFDAKLSNWLSLPLESNWRQLARLVAHLGDGPLVFGGLGLAYGLSWLLDQAQLGQAILTIILIVLAVLIVATLIKFGLLGRWWPRQVWPCNPIYHLFNNHQRQIAVKRDDSSLWSGFIASQNL